MLPAEALGGLHEEFCGLGRHRSAPVVGGKLNGLTVLPNALEQMSDGSRCEAEGLGDGGAILAGLVAPPDGLAHGHRERTRHGRSSIEGLASRTLPQCMVVPGLAAKLR